MSQYRFAILFLAALALAPTAARAEADPTNAELKRQLDVLASEIQKLKVGEAAAPTASESRAVGFGPGASKVYSLNHGVSIGGYGQSLYENFGDSTQTGAASNQTDKIHLLQAILYAGYKFDDHFVFNSEIEFEDTGTEHGGVATMEFAYLDYLYKPELSFRAGLLLMPMGFINELHEPTVFLGTHRPETEEKIIPSTWSDMGVGLFGQSGDFQYRSYVVSGLNASGFTAAEGISTGREGGGSGASAESWASVTRVDYTGIPGVIVGGSAYLGTATSNAVAGSQPVSVPMHLYEAHVDIRHRGFQARFLGAYDFIGKLSAVPAAPVGLAAIGTEQWGYYLEGGYDLFSGEHLALIPFARWEEANTQAAVSASGLRDPANDRSCLTVGLQFKPIEQIVVKTDYQKFWVQDQSGVNQWNVGLGYVF